MDKINGKVVRNERFTTIEKEKLKGLENMFYSANYTSDVKIEEATNESNYPLQEHNGQGFVSVPWEDTTYSVRGFVGTSSTVKTFDTTTYSLNNSFACTEDDQEGAVFIALKEADGDAPQGNTYIGGISCSYKKKLDELITWYEQQISQ